MSNIFCNPSLLNSVLAIREQMDELRPQYESATRALEQLSLTALNDPAEQSLTAARDIDLGVGTNLAASYRLDEVARASFRGIEANVEVLKATIDSSYGIDLEAVKTSLAAAHGID